jgi:hypothetical protein
MSKNMKILVSYTRIDEVPMYKISPQTKKEGENPVGKKSP